MIVTERDEDSSPFPVWARGGQAPLRVQTSYFPRPVALPRRGQAPESGYLPRPVAFRLGRIPGAPKLSPAPPMMIPPPRRCSAMLLPGHDARFPRRAARIEQRSKGAEVPLDIAKAQDLNPKCCQFKPLIHRVNEHGMPTHCRASESRAE
jgi:hypothetical protein